MAKIRTLSHFQDAVDRELAWRTKEFANLKSSLNETRQAFEAMLLRASIALTYAHWEGFIKNTSENYVELVASRNLRFSELQNCFVFLGLKKHLYDIGATKQQSRGQESLRYVREMLDQPGGLTFKNAINIDGNLNSDVFDNISCGIGIDPSPYQPYYNLMDERLLKNRNKIAHGEQTELGREDVLEIIETILKLLRWYKTDLENAASLETYKIAV